MEGKEGVAAKEGVDLIFKLINIMTENLYFDITRVGSVSGLILYCQFIRISWWWSLYKCYNIIIETEKLFLLGDETEKTPHGAWGTLMFHGLLFMVDFTSILLLLHNQPQHPINLNLKSFKE